MKTHDFFTRESPSQPGRILVASQNCGCRAVAGDFTPCPLHVHSTGREEEFLKRAEAAQENYNKGLARALPPDGSTVEPLPLRDSVNSVFSK
jgi:hypothetical protein